MQTYVNFIKSIPQDKKIQSIKDYLLFKEKGVIGDCVLRELATSLCNDVLNGQGGAAFWMTDLANAVALDLAQEYIQLLESK